MIRIDLFGSSFEEAIPAFTENYNLPSVRFSPSEREFSWAHRALGDETMTLRYNRFLAAISSTLEVGDEYSIMQAHSGQMTFESSRVTVEASLGVPYVLPGSDEEFRTSGVDYVNSVVQISKGFTRTVAEELEGDTFVDFRSTTTAKLPALRAWRRTVNLATAVLFDPTTSSQPMSLLRREMSRLVAVSMLQTFSYTSLPRPSEKLGPEPASVRTAYEFVHDNAHLTIGPAEIARAAGISVRSLQHALRRYRETTPSEVLRTVRLDHARRVLTDASPTTASVSAIAKDWGFTHLGRFSAAYFERFGQLPHQTLRSTSRHNPVDD